jgi:hypothetical protein
MKKIITLFVLALTLSSFTASKTQFSIVGKWESTVEGETFGLTFDKDGYAFIERGGMSMGGKEFEMAGEKGSMAYTVDYAKNPHELDINITRFKTNETETMLKGIFKVVNDNEILIVMDRERPTSLEGPETLTFKRK